MGVLTTGLSLAVGLGSAYVLYDAAKDAEKAADRAAAQQQVLLDLNTRAMQAENAESERRAKIEMDTANASARARAGASGAAFTGTTSDYLGYIQTESLKQYDWMVESGQSNVDVLQQTGAASIATTKAQASAYGSQALSSALSGIGGAVTIGEDAGGWSGDTAWYK
jgi:hypothetical protein